MEHDIAGRGISGCSIFISESAIAAGMTTGKHEHRQTEDRNIAFKPTEGCKQKPMRAK
jgi:hypothetical protein